MTMQRVDPIEVALRVTRVLDALGLTHTIGGSIAASFAGEPRSTVDIDVVVALAEHEVGALVAALALDFYVDEAAVRRAVRNSTSTNLIDNATSLKVDLFVAGGTPLDTEQLQRRLLVSLSDGVMLPIHPPEDILLQKLRWYRLGGEVSDRQWRDVLGIVRVQGERLDGAYLRRQAPILGVADLLERALAAQGE
ncbi:MAG: hypothetical protein AMXMBFR57_26070 [Acidimicrobiia bacterium]|jgi:hypothetical protein